MDVNQELVDKLLRSYYQTKFIDYGFDYLTNRSENKLKRRELELSILSQKRGLGLPISSDDYKRMTNDDGNFYSRIAPSVGKAGLSKIPGPSFLGGTQKNQPFFKVAHTIEDLLPSLGKSHNIGAHHGSIRRWLARAITL